MMSASGAILETYFFHAQVMIIVTQKTSMVSPMPISWGLGTVVYMGSQLAIVREP